MFNLLNFPNKLEADWNHFGYKDDYFSNFIQFNIFDSDYSVEADAAESRNIHITWRLKQTLNLLDQLKH